MMIIMVMSYYLLQSFSHLLNYGRFIQKGPSNSKGILAGPNKAVFSYLPAFSFFSTATSALQTSTPTNMPAETAKFLRFVKLTPNAFTPSKGSEKSAGFDLKSAYNYVIEPHTRAMVKTDLQIMLPEGCYGRVAPRSGLTWKNGIDTGAGVIDEDYRGDIRVILFNHSNEPFTITAGDRIAQLICERIYYPELQEVQIRSSSVLPDSLCHLTSRQ